MHLLAYANRPMEPLFLQSLRELLAKELGPGIGIVCSGVEGDLLKLWPIERAGILNAIPRRQREFAAGRTAVREAMVQIGWSPQAIPCAADRSPIWPNGLTASITHNDRVCVAIAGHSDQVYAMGIDVEEDLALDSAFWETLCTSGELAAMTLLHPSERGRRVTRLFCIKEAFYKWQFPQTKRMLDFCDVEVSFNLNHLGFWVHPVGFENSSLPSCSREGRILAFNGLVLAWLIGPPALHTSGN